MKDRTEYNESDETNIFWIKQINTSALFIPNGNDVLRARRASSPLWGRNCKVLWESFENTCSCVDPSCSQSPGLDHRPDGKAGLIAKTPASRRTARNDRFLNTLPKNQSRREAAEELGTLLGRPPVGKAVVISNNSRPGITARLRRLALAMRSRRPNCQTAQRNWIISQKTTPQQFGRDYDVITNWKNNHLHSWTAWSLIHMVKMLIDKHTTSRKLQAHISKRIQGFPK